MNNVFLIEYMCEYIHTYKLLTTYMTPLYLEEVIRNYQWLFFWRGSNGGVVCGRGSVYLFFN